MTNVVPLKPWHRSRIAPVEAVGPFLSFVMLTLFDGRILIIPGTPHVVNSTDVQKKARKDDKHRKRQAKYRQRGSITSNKRHKHDRLRATTAWLRESELEQVLADVKSCDDRPITRKEWRDIESRVITAAVRSTLKSSKS